MSKDLVRASLCSAGDYGLKKRVGMVIAMNIVLFRGGALPYIYIYTHACFRVKKKNRHLQKLA
jgi:hypothetical protein